MSRYECLQETDKRTLWHPFTAMQDWMSQEAVIIERGQGNYLIDVKGKRYLDGVSSLWVTLHGHNHPYLNRAIRKQLKKIAHSTFLGLSNVPAIELANKLLMLVPQNLARVFYSDNGSTSVEIALKMAFQYWQQHPDSAYHTKTIFISFNHAYHGDTIGSVSVGGLDLFHQLYGPLLFQTYTMPYPYPFREGLKLEESEARCLTSLEACLKKNHSKIAGLIIEPLMQGAAGMLQTSAQFLQKIRMFTQKYNVLLIADEVATGFGRTGDLFACEKAGVEPDILCLAKGLTGGYLPLAATITTEGVFSRFLGEITEHKTFYHGHTYTGNPLACAVALANLKWFERRKVLAHLSHKIVLLMNRLSEFEELPHVAQVRQEGFMVGIELALDPEKRLLYPEEQRVGWNVAREAIRRGVFLRPLGDVIILMPPLSITEKELNILLDVTKQCIISQTKE